MRPDELQSLLRVGQFRPFRMHLTGGKTADVRHSELAVVEKSVVWIHQPKQGPPKTVGQDRYIVVLLHIVWIEFL
jgi:hypothetical protein